MMNLDQREANLNAKIQQLEGRQQQIDEQAVTDDSPELTQEAIQIAGELDATRRALNAIPAQRLEEQKGLLLEKYHRAKTNLAEYKQAHEKAHQLAESAREQLKPLTAEEKRTGQLFMDTADIVQGLKSDLRRLGVEV